MLSGDAIGWLLAASTVLTLLSGLVAFRTNTFLNLIFRLAEKFGHALISGVSSDKSPVFQNNWRWRAAHEPGSFWAFRWPIRSFAITVMVFAGLTAITLTFLHLDIDHFRAEQVILTIRNDSSDIVHYRYARHSCVDGPNAYFNDSITLGDPRLKPLQPDQSFTTSAGVMDYNANNESVCHRLGVVDGTGRVGLLESFTSKELNRMNWQLAFSE